MVVAQQVFANNLPKLDVGLWIDCGQLRGMSGNRVTMTARLRKRVDEEIARMNRERKAHGQPIGH